MRLSDYNPNLLFRNSQHCIIEKEEAEDLFQKKKLLYVYKHGICLMALESPISTRPYGVLLFNPRRFYEVGNTSLSLNSIIERYFEIYGEE